MAVRAFDLDEVAALTSGRVLARGGSVRGLCLDSRQVVPGQLFAALKGDRADGHEHVPQACAAGAAAVLVEREVAVPQGAGAVLVDSVEQAVRALGAVVRSEFSGEVVGVVGSCGKTTTKDFTAAVLSLAGSVHATSGNRNNLLGVPETLMAADMGARFWVLELGISQPGEMEDLAPIARPTAVVFTTIQPVHVEFFPSLEAIREEKAKVLRWTSPEGFAAVNADDGLLSALALPKGMGRVSYGFSPGADLRVEAGEAGPAGTAFTLTAQGRSAKGFLPVAGVHNLSNFCAACACGLRYGLALEALAGAASLLKPARHRGETSILRDDVLLLDDSYNANPSAVAAVLRSVGGWGRRTVAALGEMLELGDEGPSRHEAVGRLAAEAGVSCLLAVGGHNAALMAEAFGRSGREVRHVAAWGEGAGWLDEKIRPGDGVLVKGSRGIALDGLVEWLVARRGA